MTDLPEEAVEAGAQALHAYECNCGGTPTVSHVHMAGLVLTAALKTGEIVTWEQALYDSDEVYIEALREQRRQLRARVEELEADRGRRQHRLLELRGR